MDVVPCWPWSPGSLTVHAGEWRWNVRRSWRTASAACDQQRRQQQDSKVQDSKVPKRSHGPFQSREWAAAELSARPANLRSTLDHGRTRQSVGLWYCRPTLNNVSTNDCCASCRFLEVTVPGRVRRRLRFQPLAFSQQARQPLPKWAAHSRFVALVERARLTVRLASARSALRASSWHRQHDLSPW